MDKEYIAEYYDETLPYYKRFWHRDSESNALHYGFWENGTKSVGEALLNENRFLAEVAGIKPADKVLDAGCGVGGSAIWIAKNIGATVVGITISKKQMEKAKELAKESKADKKAEFQIGDYLSTNFPSSSFDVVWAIESVCHAERKIDFLCEAHRILRPGGRLVVADGFLRRDVLPEEKMSYQNFLAGLALSNISQFSDFKKWMEEVGFRDIQFWDKTGDIKKSSEILYRRCLLAYPFFKIANILGFVPDIVMKNGPAGIAQYKLVRFGVMGYGVFLGRK